MAHSRVRRHYRVAEKEVSQSPSKGTFVTHSNKNKMIFAIAGLFVMLFLKGFLFGYIFGQKNND